MKHHSTLLTTLATTFLALGSACDLEPEPLEDFDSPRLRGDDGGGATLGDSLGYNNPYHASILSQSIQSVHKEVNGQMELMDDFWSEQGILHVSYQGVEYSGAELVGSVWLADVTRDGANYLTREFVLDAIEPGSPDHYAFLVDGVHPGCSVLGASGVVLAGYYVEPDGDVVEQANTLTIGCTGGGIEKAVAWGYGPWEVGIDGFQAAIRMIIADYCGDGSSYTEEGTPFLRRDTWGTPEPIGHAVEAGWDEDGATCLGTLRNSTLERPDIACEQTLPDCPGHPYDPMTAGDLMASYYASMP